MQKLHYVPDRLPDGHWRWKLMAGSVEIAYSANDYGSRAECEMAIEGMKVAHDSNITVH